MTRIEKLAAAQETIDLTTSITTAAFANGAVEEGTAGNIYDDDMTTSWGFREAETDAGNVNGTMTVDLGKLYLYVDYRAGFSALGGGTGNNCTCYFETSPNNTTWTTQATVASGLTEAYQYFIGTIGAARYFRIRLTGTGWSGGGAVTVRGKIQEMYLLTNGPRA